MTMVHLVARETFDADDAGDSGSVAVLGFCVQFLEGTMVAVTRPPDSSTVQLHMHPSHWVGDDSLPTETELISAKALYVNCFL